MNSDEAWASCAECGTALEHGDKICPKCGSTRKVHDLGLSDGIVLGESELRFTQKRKGYRGFIVKMIGRLKPSGDPKLRNGVWEDLMIDREKDEYHQVVKDARTGKVTHEEHEQLSKHDRKGG